MHSNGNYFPNKKDELTSTRSSSHLRTTTDKKREKKIDSNLPTFNIPASSRWNSKGENSYFNSLQSNNCYESKQKIHTHYSSQNSLNNYNSNNSNVSIIDKKSTLPVSLPVFESLSGSTSNAKARSNFPSKIALESNYPLHDFSNPENLELPPEKPRNNHTSLPSFTSTGFLNYFTNSENKTNPPGNDSGLNSLYTPIPISRNTKPLQTSALFEKNENDLYSISNSIPNGNIFAEHEQNTLDSRSTPRAFDGMNDKTFKSLEKGTLHQRFLSPAPRLKDSHQIPDPYKNYKAWAVKEHSVFDETISPKDRSNLNSYTLNNNKITTNHESFIQSNHNVSEVYTNLNKNHSRITKYETVEKRNSLQSSRVPDLLNDSDKNSRHQAHLMVSQNFFQQLHINPTTYNNHTSSIDNNKENTQNYENHQPNKTTKPNRAFSTSRYGNSKTGFTEVESNSLMLQEQKELCNRYNQHTIFKDSTSNSCKIKIADSKLSNQLIPFRHEIEDNSHLLTSHNTSFANHQIKSKNQMKTTVLYNGTPSPTPPPEAHFSQVPIELNRSNTKPSQEFNNCSSPNSNQSSSRFQKIPTTTNFGVKGMTGSTSKVNNQQILGGHDLINESNRFGQKYPHKPPEWIPLTPQLLFCTPNSHNRMPFSQMPEKLKEFETLRGKDRILGIGAYGMVLKARHRDRSKWPNSNHFIAIKVISEDHFSSRGLGEQLKREIFFHSSCNHPNILPCYYYLKTKDHYFLILEGMSGSLKNFASHIQEWEICDFIKQTLNAARYLDENKILHRDIKLDNILWNPENVIKLSDFGWCADFNKSYPQDVAGSFQYMAPEILTGAYQTPKIDIWSIGCCTYELFTGDPLFSLEMQPSSAAHMSANDWISSQMRKLHNSNYIENLTLKLQKLNVSKEAINFIRGTLAYLPENRIDASTALSHPWFRRLKTNISHSSTTSSVITSFDGEYNNGLHFSDDT